jgi:hypothetical protein
MGEDTKDRHRVISMEHVEGAMAAFLIAHEDCPPELVELHRGEWSVVCWCRWCSDLKTFEMRVD